MAGNNMDGLSVTYDALDITATKIANEARDLETDLRELKRLIENSVQYWEGEAQDAFKAKLDRWDKEATDIHTALTGIGHVVATAGGTYMEGDKRGASYLQ
ncbi:WXG100 family type VII secretion target [Streptomyces brasiliscabiei]|uniref:WXG100 family type VII secretion target n=1 Tax=Streptomyces brasiliscabiei TaxID=2736302 RepID=UPI001C108609|nr:WXG100 family type VII secretion target [Streptomyces brasiliscabiei]